MTASLLVLKNKTINRIFVKSENEFPLQATCFLAKVYTAHFMERCCYSSLLHIENKEPIPSKNTGNGLFDCYASMKNVKTLCRMVDWRGVSVTPRGLSVTEETLERTEVSEAAHRAPPGKDAGGTEINPTPY